MKNTPNAEKMIEERIGRMQEADDLMDIGAHLHFWATQYLYVLNTRLDLNKKLGLRGGKWMMVKKPTPGYAISSISFVFKGGGKAGFTVERVRGDRYKMRYVISLGGPELAGTYNDSRTVNYTSSGTEYGATISVTWQQAVDKAGRAVGVNESTLKEAEKTVVITPYRYDNSYSPMAPDHRIEDGDVVWVATGMERVDPRGLYVKSFSKKHGEINVIKKFLKKVGKPIQLRVPDGPGRDDIRALKQVRAYLGAG